MIYLTVEELLRIADSAVGGTAHVRDPGLLASAAARPQATVFGEDAYPGVLTKAAALMHSLVKNHALHDGNKRLGWLATVVFCALNGAEIDMPTDEAFELTIGVATDRYDLAQIEAILAKHSA